MARFNPIIDEIAKGQAGVVSRAQARAAGMSDRSIQTAVRSRRWRRIFPGVYQVHGGPVSEESRWWAGVLRIGGFSALSHESAARSWGIADERPIASREATEFLPPVDVSVSHIRKVRRQPGIRLHRRRTMGTLVAAGALPSRTSVESTVIDLAADAKSARQLTATLVIACQRRRTTPARLRSELARRPWHPRRALLCAILADVAGGAETPLELEYLINVERARGPPTGEKQRRIVAAGVVMIVDVDYVDHNGLVELDGRVAHEGDGRHRDRVRDNANVLRGTPTLRFGWTSVHDMPCDTAGQVAILLHRGGWQGAPHPCRRPRCRIGRADHAA